MPTITGTPGDDTLVGTAASDLIQGLAGNDHLTDTLGGDDVLDGGDDDDLIEVTRPDNGTVEQLLGGNGNDILRFTGARNTEDFISGGAGADRIDATGFNFSVDAGSGDDSVYVRKEGGGNAPTVTLGSGSDAIGFLGSDLKAQIVVVNDFTPGDGGDRIDWGATLAYLWGWDQSGNPFAAGYLSFVQSGDIVAVNVKVNPPSDNTGVNVFFFSGFAPSALTAFNLGGYAPDGSAPANLALAGTAAADALNGGNGNDTITGDAGNDVLNGGAGHDEIHGGADNDTIDGWLGNDTIFGDGGDDVIVDDYGFRGTIDGGSGNDTITVDIGKHPALPLTQPAAPTMFQRTIDGGDGNDRITVVGYSPTGTQRLTEATINGGANDDIIDVFRTYAVIDAGTGDDLVIVRNSIRENSATVTLGGGVDTLRITDIASDRGTPIAAVTVTDFATGPGGDVVDIPALVISRDFGWNYEGNPFAGGLLRLVASGPDTLLQGKISAGTYVTLAIIQSVAPAAFTAENLAGFDPNGAPPAPQLINGTPDDDTLAGGIGDDVVSGLAGDDILTGFFGNDTLNGGDDNDILDGQWGSDTLNGGAGDDILNDSLGNDTFNGGDGNDIITAIRGGGSWTLSVDGGDGDDNITVRYAIGSVSGGAGNDVMVIDSSGPSMTVDGGSGDDDITVDAAIIDAGSGNDIIRSTGGHQELTLGAGRDVVLPPLTATSITIHDFQVGEEGDRLDLSIFGANPFGPGGALIIEQIGANVRIRKDGISLESFVLENVTAGDLSTYNLGVPTGFFNPAPRSFTGTPGPDSYISADGNDTLSGQGGNDVLYGAGGNDVINGGDGNDELVGGTGNDVINGGADNDFLEGGAGADQLAGGTGNDVYLVDGPTDVILEGVGEGFDVVYSRSDFTLGDQAEIEVLSSVSQAATIAMVLVGNGFDQTIYGNAGNNFLQGGGGTDYLVGLGGNDTYFVAGPGDNVAESARGGTRDVIYTPNDYTMIGGVEVEVLSSSNQPGTGPQTLIGNEFGQEIYGNAGVNFIEGGGGADFLMGLGGNDVYVVDGMSDYVGESVGGGRDVVYAQASYALAAGQEVEVLSTSSSAGTGAIDLTGNNLANELYGNNGANVLNGGAGGDYLVGYGGADTFAFTTALGGGNVDQLADFTAVDDTIALDDAVFAGLTPGALPAGAFVAGSAAGDADDRIIYNSATGQILFDADGNGGGAAILFATVQPGTALTASDFVVI